MKLLVLKLKLHNLSDNGSTDTGNLQIEFRLYNSRDESFIRKSSFKSARISAKPKFSA